MPGRHRPAPNAAEFAPMDTTDALRYADTNCRDGLHLEATVRRGDKIYGPGFRRRPVGQIYCRNCMDVLDGAR